MNAKQIQKELHKHINKEKAAFYPRFFKTGKGKYGEGDKFLGITVPNIRKIAKKYRDTEFKELQKLLDSKWHEERLTGLLILTYKFEKASPEEKKNIYDFYLKNLKAANNWDLVDLSAYKIIGQHLLDKDRKILYKLAKSKDLWEKRIAILSTFAFIKNNQLEDTIKISEILLKDNHDLIHKAVGWMLRELGKRDQKELEKFLNKYYQKMPRTMLRYSLEKLPEKLRKHYMQK